MVLAAAVLLTPASGIAQVTTGTIFGAVQDETGGSVPGVAVTIKDLETGVVREVVTDAEGRYRAPNLQSGTYEIAASLEGFRTEVRTGISLSIGREAVVDFRLVVGQVVERLVVVGEAPLVETSNAVTSALIDERQIKNLPLNGRDLTQLTLLTAGVLPARGAASYGPARGRCPPRS
jgi:hypothetical protein